MHAMPELSVVHQVEKCRCPEHTNSFVHYQEKGISEVPKKLGAGGSTSRVLLHNIYQDCERQDVSAPDITVLLVEADN